MDALSRWLDGLGLARYAPRLAENGVDLDSVGLLTDSDLERLGVLLGHRRRLLNAITELKGGGPGLASASQDLHDAAKVTGTDAERRQITILFCDLVDSTALAARLDLEDMREVIGAYRRCCAEHIAKAGGFVAKYMGDGVLAYFGYPQAHEDDAERGIRAGLALSDAIPKLRAERNLALQARIGIATGVVVVGDLIGSGEAQERGIVGETPNLAARLQAIAEPGQVVVAPGTRRLVGGLFRYRDLGPLELKGFAEPVQASLVLGVSTFESRFEARCGTAITPLIGREEEMDLLMRRWRQAREGEGSVVLISGEPGIGKSRIVQATLERLGDERYARMRFFGSPHHRDTALFPAIAHLERAAGLRRDDTDDQRLEKLEALLAETTQDPETMVPLVAGLLSIPIGDRYPPVNLGPQQQKEKTLKALAAQVEASAARQPVLVVVEDAHWIDPTSLELFDMIVDRVPELPLLMIITYRAEFAAPWTGRPHVTSLILNRLARRQRAEMVARVTEGKALPKEIVDQIIDRTDGIPLFIEELTKAVIESDVFADAGGRHRLADDSAPLAIPATLHASLLARLDRLAPAREVAQIGAALGRRFSHELISAVAPMPQEQLDEALAQLARAELILCRGTPPDAEYAFKHALVQDAAYSTLLRGRREQLHGRITAALENRFPDIVAAQPALLAQHCTEAGQPEKAVGYRLKAGRQALARSAMVEAAAQLQKGLGLLADLPENIWRAQQELDLQIALGRALMATKGYSAPAVRETIVRARALADHCDRRDRLVPLLYSQWISHLTRAEHRLARSLAEQIEKLGEVQRDETTLLLGHNLHGVSRFFLGDFAAARALFEQCDGLRDLGHRAACAAWTAEDPHAVCLAWRAFTLAILGHLDQARTQIGEALSEARRLGHAHTLAFVLVWACWVAWVVRSPGEARDYAEEAMGLADEHGFRLWRGAALLHRGWSSVALGSAEEGLRVLTEGHRVFREIGNVASASWALTMLAEAHARLGHTVESLSCLAEAMQIVETSEERYSEAELYRWRGEVLARVGDQVAAEENYRRALAIARRQDTKTLELRAACSLARLWRDQSRRTDARRLLAPICSWFTEGLDTTALIEAKLLLAELA